MKVYHGRATSTTRQCRSDTEPPAYVSGNGAAGAVRRSSAKSRLVTPQTPPAGAIWATSAGASADLKDAKKVAQFQDHLKGTQGRNDHVLESFT